MSLVSLLIDIKLKAKFGRPNTNDKLIEEVGFTVPDPIMLQTQPSTTVIGLISPCDRKLEYISRLPVI